MMDNESLAQNRQWVRAEGFPAEIEGCSAEEREAALRAVQELRAQKSDLDYEQMVIADIPPVTILLHGALREHTYTGTNRAYRAFRTGIYEVTKDHLSLSQTGRVVARMVKGYLPKDTFEFVPGQGITYDGTNPEGLTKEKLGAAVGGVTAGHILAILWKTTHPED